LKKFTACDANSPPTVAEGMLFAAGMQEEQCRFRQRCGQKGNSPAAAMPSRQCPLVRYQESESILLLQ